jgi:hypothetical protein
MMSIVSEEKQCIKDVGDAYTIFPFPATESKWKEGISLVENKNGQQTDPFTPAAEGGDKTI